MTSKRNRQYGDKRLQQCRSWPRSWLCLHRWRKSARPTVCGMTWPSEPATPPRERAEQVVYLSLRGTVRDEAARQTDGLADTGWRSGRRLWQRIDGETLLARLPQHTPSGRDRDRPLGNRRPPIGRTCPRRSSCWRKTWSMQRWSGSTRANWLRFPASMMETNGPVSRPRAASSRSGSAVPTQPPILDGRKVNSSVARTLAKNSEQMKLRRNTRVSLKEKLHSLLVAITALALQRRSSL